MNYKIKFTQEESLLQALNSKFTEAEMSVANYFFSRARSNAQFRVSYEIIAKQIKIKNRTKVCRETVRRAINKLISLNLLKRIKEKFYMGACKYRVNILVFKVAEQVKNKFKSLFKYLAIRAIKLWKPNVAPLYKYSNILPRKSYVVDNQSPKNIKRGYFLPKREDVEVSQPKISPTLREITEKLRLTKLGQLKLMVFPADILSSVWNHCKKLSEIKDPFGLLVANCLKRAEKQDIVISWDLFYLSLKRYKLEDNKKYTFPKPVAEKTDIQPVTEVKIHRPHANKKEPNPLFAEFYLKAMENMLE